MTVPGSPVSQNPAVEESGLFDLGSAAVPEHDEPPAPDALILPPAAREEIVGAPSIGLQGRPFDRRNPFFVGFTGALGVATAYVLVRGVIDVASVLVVIGVALFLAVGLNPIIEFLTNRHLARGAAVAIVTISFVLVGIGFAILASIPLAHEVSVLVANYPRYRAEALSGKGFLGEAATRLHLDGYLKGREQLHLSISGGLLGAGKAILSVGVGAISVGVLTIYFLIALSSVESFFLGLFPRSRRERVRLLTEEVFDRVGGFMLGNLLTSLVSGVGTYVWLMIFGVPYRLLLALLVALLDLIPMVGSTIAGVVVALVALTRGLPIAIGTAAFYIVYRFLEDYLLNPRVMRHTVRISPGLTIIATLIGGALLGIVGALVAIPTAATVHLIYDEVVVTRQNGR